MVTVAPNPPPPSPPPGPKLDSLTSIDVSKFSQSELHALSLCSDAAFDLRRTDDLVIPAVDRSVFNESAGTRRQTYSRPRRSAPGRRPRLAGLHHPHSPDPHRAENKAIVNFLKQFLGEKQNSAQFSQQSELQLVVYDQAGEAQRANNAAAGNQETAIEVHSSERKRKRMEKPKASVVEEGNGTGIQLEIVNQNGVAVDLAALENADEIYSGELKRRTGVLGSEEQGLGFLGGLDGQWCSRRKKRRIVDAGEFGDSLPIGWKLLLALKKREGRVWVHCRRYISPTGQHFESCKEVASYLQSYFGQNDANPPTNQRIGSIKQTTHVIHAGLANKANHTNNMLISNPTISHPQNLSEVQVQDLYECYKCNMRFDERDVYFDHLLSVHQKTTRRYRLGTSVGEGVIIKDGKYECQFCHKAFEERKRYNGHVGNHIKKYVRNAKELAGLIPAPKNSVKSLPQDRIPSRISKMDALVEIAQNSILETSRDGGSRPKKRKENTATGEITVSSSVNFDIRKNINELEKYGNGELDLRNLELNLDVVTDSVKENVKEEEIVKETMIDFGVNDPSTQSIDRTPAFTAVQNKKLENVTRFEELRLDRIKPLKYTAVNLQASSPSLGNEEDRSKLESAEPTRNKTGGKQKLTAVCVWCRKEFKHEAIDLESQSDSIGFMCPSCKSKISGHLDSGLSIASHPC